MPPRRSAPSVPFTTDCAAEWDIRVSEGEGEMVKGMLPGILSYDEAYD